MNALEIALFALVALALALIVAAVNRLRRRVESLERDMADLLRDA